MGKTVANNGNNSAAGGGAVRGAQAANGGGGEVLKRNAAAAELRRGIAEAYLNGNRALRVSRGLAHGKARRN